MTLDAETQRCADEMWRRAGVPALHRDFAQSTNKAWEATLEAVYDAVGDGRIIVLLGPTGTGKTQLLVEVVRQACPVAAKCFIDQRRNAGAAFGLTELSIPTYLTLSAFYGTLRDGFAAGDANRRLQHLSWSPLVAIDEIGIRGFSEWENDRLVTLVDARYGERRPLLMAGNIAKGALSTYLDERIVSRIMERGHVVEMRWPSFRVAHA